MSKITDYTELAEVPNNNDFVVVVDVSDTSMSASGTTKKVKKSNIIDGGSIGYVNHGATAGTSRPSGYGVIFWYGSVTPTNATNGDVWVDTA